MGINTYTIFGRQVGSHYLAIATLATTGALSYWAMSGEKKKPTSEEARLKFQAESKEEEAFIAEFIRDAEEQEKKMKADAK